MKSLPELMQEDGVQLVSKGTDDYMALCPFHDERTPSFHVFVGTGGEWAYHCFGCGSSGDDVKWLTDYREIPIKEAMQARRSDRKDVAPTSAAPEKNASRKTQKPREIISALPSNHIARYYYYSVERELVFVIQKYVDKDGRKFFGQYTPKENGWIKGMTIEWDRPLYKVRQVLSAPKEQQIMVVEGEKCVEAVMESFPNTVVCAWACGTKSIDKTDFSPLHGHPIMLVADSDAVGYLAMGHLARKLQKYCPKIVLVLPTLTWDKSRDIADFLEEDKSKVPAWIGKAAIPWNDQVDERMKLLEQKVEERKKALKARKIAEHKIKDNEFFQIMEVNDEKLTIKINDIIEMSMNIHTLSRPHVLLSLCSDVDFWYNTTGYRPNGTSSRQIAQLLFDCAKSAQTKRES